jgi:aquaporin Z
MKSYITEFIGTFFLVFVVGLAVASGTPFAPLAIGGTLMVMVYMGGHISGGHYNPAVTLATLLPGAIALPAAMGYMVSQVLGGLVAGLATTFMVGSAINIAPNANFGIAQVLFVEIIFTFSLALTVLNVATVKGSS